MKNNLLYLAFILSFVLMSISSILGFFYKHSTLNIVGFYLFLAISLILLCFKRIKARLLQNKYFVFVIFIIMGYLFWLSALYIFTFGTTKLFPFFHAAHKTVSVSLLKSAIWFLYLHATYLVLIIIFSCFLGRFFGYKTIWFIAFVFWPIGISLFTIVESLLVYMSEYTDGLPKGVTNYIFNSTLAYLIISPLLAWGGLLLGDKKFKNKIKA